MKTLVIGLLYTSMVLFLSLLVACSASEDEGESVSGDFSSTSGSSTSGYTGGSGSTSSTSAYTSSTGSTGEQGWLYVLIEDLSQETEGQTPGADLDAISVILSDTGEELFATTVDDTNVTDQETRPWNDPQEALGEPDSECDLQGFVSLGGMKEDGYVIVGFSTVDREVRIRRGDSIKVYELGESTCPNREDWEDDPYAVSLSLLDDRETFLEIGSSVEGKNIIIVEP